MKTDIPVFAANKSTDFIHPRSVAHPRAGRSGLAPECLVPSAVQPDPHAGRNDPRAGRAHPRAVQVVLRSEAVIRSAGRVIRRVGGADLRPDQPDLPSGRLDLDSDQPDLDPDRPALDSGLINLSRDFSFRGGGVCVFGQVSRDTGTDFRDTSRDFGGLVKHFCYLDRGLVARPWHCA
jgi:hypothetical protein